MNKVLSSILLWVLVVLSSQAWCYAPTTSPTYTYDADSYLYIDRNIESEGQIFSYDGERIPFRSVDDLQVNSTDEKTRIGVYFALLADFMLQRVQRLFHHYKFLMLAERLFLMLRNRMKCFLESFLATVLEEVS